MALQPTLDLTNSEACDTGSQNYRQPLKKFRALAVASGLISGNDDMGVLRQACRDLGLDKACWRFLIRYDEDAYAAVMPFATDNKSLMLGALPYIRWQCLGGLQKPLAGELGRRFITCLGGFYDPVSEIDPRIARVANSHWQKLEDPVRREFFARDEWVRVLNWMRDEQPSFDRNQWRTGWSAIYRRYQQWQKLNPRRLAWQSLLPEFDRDGFHVQPLTSSFELAKEGERMGNCVATYAKRCISGHYRLFSISEISSGRMVAMAGLVKEGAYWKIDQVKGRFNRDPEERAARLGRVIQQKYIQQEELIAREEVRKERLENKRCVEQLREEHKVYAGQRQAFPKAIQAEFNREEIDFLEKNAAWLGALVSGELRPNAFEQVRFIAVSKGILVANTEHERIWKRFLRACNELGYPGYA